MKIILAMVHLIIVLLLFHCTRQPAGGSPVPGGENYIQARNDMVNKKFNDAIEQYDRAVLKNPKLYNIHFLREMMYTLAQSKLDSTNYLLRAQRLVALNPTEKKYRTIYLKFAVQPDKNSLIAFGFGYQSVTEQMSQTKLTLAARAAYMDAVAWVARAASWHKRGIDAPYDVVTNVRNIQKIKETWIHPHVCLMLVKAPLAENLP